MKNITLTVFINEWLPEAIRNKIFQYACECRHLKHTCRDHVFKMGGKRYSVMSTYYLGGFLPYRTDGFKTENHSQRTCASFTKIMKTIVNKNDILKMKSVGKLDITRRNGSVNTIEYEKLDTTYIQYFEYTNITELENFSYGLYLRQVETLWVYHYPYNNGAVRRCNIHNDITPPILVSFTPLQMLWRINHGIISIENLKELSRINQINGRSKLKTRKDFIIAFMKL